MKISTFPNPLAKGESLEIKTNNDFNMELAITNATGLNVWKSHVESNAHLINTSDFQSGVYTLKVFKEGKFIAVKN